VPLTELAPASVERLESLLDPGLPAVNPLDAWSTGGPDYHVGMQRCFATLMSDAGAAVGAVVHDRDRGRRHPGQVHRLPARRARRFRQAAFLVANTPRHGADPNIVAATREGFPVLDGLSPFLRGVRALFEYRDFRRGRRCSRHRCQPTAVARCLRLVQSGAPLDEFDAMQLLHERACPRVPVASSRARPRRAGPHASSDSRSC
jgi:hypothetical protein